MTPAEQLAARALAECRLLPASWEKRFINDLASQSRYHGPPLTEKQVGNLWRLVHRYRRQVPAHIQSLSPQNKV